jgi:beta-N-acetylhexosaminidase
VTDVARLAAACLAPSFRGADAPEWILRLVERGLGGITLFAENARDRDRLAASNARLRDAGDILLSIDEEGGDVTRLEAASGSSYPGNFALGLVDDPALTTAVAGAIAGELAAAGVNMNLAPVADVNTNPQNPVIGVRSFGADPELVARHVAAFVTGTQREGVVACAKHFPGHGDTSVDSHVDLPSVSGDLAAALLPFRAAVGAGARAVMVGHLLVPELDERPATLSRRITNDLLREELGFGALAVTDALEMRAISGRIGLEEGAVRALVAGADVVCLGRAPGEEQVEAVIDAIVDAVTSGLLPLERLERSAARVAETARWTAAPEHANAAPPTPAVGEEAARRALRVREAPRLAAPPLVLELVPEANYAAGVHEHGLAAMWAGATSVRLSDADVVPRELVEGDHGIVVVLRDAARHRWQVDLAREVVELRPEAVLIETGLPGGVPVAIETGGAGRVNLEAACAVLRAVGDEGSSG